MGIIINRSNTVVTNLGIVTSRLNVVAERLGIICYSSNAVVAILGISSKIENKLNSNANIKNKSMRNERKNGKEVQLKHPVQSDKNCSCATQTNNLSRIEFIESRDAEKLLVGVLQTLRGASRPCREGALPTLRFDGFFGFVSFRFGSDN